VLSDRQPNPPSFVDTHAHLDEPAFDRDRGAVIAAARAAGVVRIVNIGYRPARWLTSAALAREEPAVAVALGLHPHHADEFDADTIDRLTDAVTEAAAVAIGETGLDYFRNRTDATTQRRAFLAQIELGQRLGLPIVIHQRAAEADLIEVLDHVGSLPPVVLHSFEGSRRLADLAIAREFFVGVGGLATRPSATALRKVLAGIPIRQVLLETDAPYLAPAGVKDRRNEPANIPAIARALAPLWGISAPELATQTTRTATDLFRLDREDDGNAREGVS
jgi:TatD DNase family protein